MAIRSLRQICLLLAGGSFLLLLSWLYLPSLLGVVGTPKCPGILCTGPPKVSKNNSISIANPFLTFKSSSATKFTDESETATVSPKAGGSGYGYVMATSFFDQLTGSMANLLTMQCWAASVSPQIRVVEPFMSNTLFGVNLNAIRESSNTVKLGHMFRWETEKSYAPLVNWDYFITHAPRKLILVDRECLGVDAGKKCMECNSGYRAFLDSAKDFANRYHFKIVRRACHPSVLIPESKFKKLVYSAHDPSQVVVLFNMWGGVNNFAPLTIRIPLTGPRAKKCYRGQFLNINMPVSESVIRDSDNYIKRYLPEGVNKGYISVMMRTEHLLNSFHKFRGKSDEEILLIIKKCCDSILTKVNALKNEYGVESVFFTADNRKQGSAFFNKPSGSTLVEVKNMKTYLGSVPKLQNEFFIESGKLERVSTESVSKLYQMLFGNSSTLDEWDRSFEEIASFGTAGYIGLLQRYLAIKATCLLTAGGGVFQANARKFHSLRHHESPPCAFQIKECGTW